MKVCGNAKSEAEMVTPLPLDPKAGLSQASHAGRRTRLKLMAARGELERDSTQFSQPIGPPGVRDWSQGNHDGWEHLLPRTV